MVARRWSVPLALSMLLARSSGEDSGESVRNVIAPCVRAQASTNTSNREMTTTSLRPRTNLLLLITLRLVHPPATLT